MFSEMKRILEFLQFPSLEDDVLKARLLDDFSTFKRYIYKFYRMPKLNAQFREIINWPFFSLESGQGYKSIGVARYSGHGFLLCI